jgi:hypothetical protein
MTPTEYDLHLSHYDEQKKKYEVQERDTEGKYLAKPTTTEIMRTLKAAVLAAVTPEQITESIQELYLLGKTAKKDADRIAAWKAFQDRVLGRPKQRQSSPARPTHQTNVQVNAMNNEQAAAVLEALTRLEGNAS